MRPDPSDPTTSAALTSAPIGVRDGTDPAGRCNASPRDGLLARNTGRELGEDAGKGAGEASPITLLQESAGLIRHAAEVLDCGIEIWTERGRLMGAKPPLACRVCHLQDPAGHAGCRARRSRAAGVPADPAAPAWSCPQGIRLECIPVVGRGGAAGSLVALSPSSLVRSTKRQRSRRRFLDDLCRMLSRQIYLHREMSSLNGELSTRYDELRLLYTLAGSLTRHEGLHQALRQALDQARSTIGADAGLLVLGDRRVRETVLRDGSLAPAPSRRDWSRLTVAIHRLLHRHGSRCFAGSPWTEQVRYDNIPERTQVLAVTVDQRPHSRGFLALLRLSSPEGFRSSDLRLLESVSEQVSLALANEELYEDLRSFLMATVKSLVGAIEAKDAYTSGHSERVHLLSLLLGRKIGLGNEEMETLRWASILHDVGKIGMPERILSKPGRLTDQEYEIIKEHPDRGYRLLAPIRQLTGAADHVLAHHETVDGKGYPHHRRGEEIPLLARIIAVADTYDALTSNRPYRTARSLDFALEEIRRVRGTQLDSGVVDCLLDMSGFLSEHRIMLAGEHGEAEGTPEELPAPPVEEGSAESLPDDGMDRAA